VTISWVRPAFSSAAWAASRLAFTRLGDAGRTGIFRVVPSAVTGEPEEARGRLRSELISYFSLPFYRAMLERSGFDPDGGPTDEFLDLLGAIGSRDEAKASVRRYAESGATSPCVGGIPGADFDATLEALAGSLD
jgi:hypothetical protein